ncbi:MAG: hypothetical protein Fur0024_0370 [Patescibacteria group bacterium]
MICSKSDFSSDRLFVLLSKIKIIRIEEIICEIKTRTTGRIGFIEYRNPENIAEIDLATKTIVKLFAETFLK